MALMYSEQLSERYLARCAHRQFASNSQRERDMYKSIPRDSTNQQHQQNVAPSDDADGPSNIGRCPFPTSFPNPARVF